MTLTQTTTQPNIKPNCDNFVSSIEINREKEFNRTTEFYDTFVIQPLKELKIFNKSDLLLLLSLIQLIYYKTHLCNTKIQLFCTDDPLGYSVVFFFLQFFCSKTFIQKNCRNNEEKIQLKELYQEYTEFIKLAHLNALGKSTFLKYLKNLYKNQLTTKKTLDGLQIKIKFSDQLTTNLNQKDLNSDYLEFYYLLTQNLNQNYITL